MARMAFGTGGLAVLAVQTRLQQEYEAARI